MGSESIKEEMSQGNGGVEPIVRQPMTLSVAVAQVESVVGSESIEVARAEQHSESDSVAATSEGRLYEFKFIGKQAFFLPG